MVRSGDMPVEEPRLAYAGFRVRILASLLDCIPITLIVYAIFYCYFGFNQTSGHYFQNREDIEARIQFLRERNRIRDLSFIIWIIYGIYAEASLRQGTLGKWIMGVKVVGQHGQRISLKTSVKRNLFKIVSYIPFDLGFIWAAFSKKKQTWHDLFAKTYVVYTSPPNPAVTQPAKAVVKENESEPLM